jgi:transposase-like protein
MAKVLRIASKIEALPVRKQVALYEAIAPWLWRMELATGEHTTLEELREARFSGGLKCPHCGGIEVQRWGRTGGKQRYRCKAEACRRTFNDLTGTPPSWSKYQSLWPAFCACMVEGLSVRKTAQRLGIHKDTAFRWRHRLLGALRRLDAPTLAGIVEADETYFRFSRKGQRGLRNPRKRGERAKKRGLSREQVGVLVARDRQGQTVAEVACLSVPRLEVLRDVLSPRLVHANALVTDGALTYGRLCVEIGLAYKQVKSRDGALLHAPPARAAARASARGLGAGECRCWPGAGVGRRCGMRLHVELVERLRAISTHR